MPASKNNNPSSVLKVLGFAWSFLYKACAAVGIFVVMLVVVLFVLFRDSTPLLYFGGIDSVEVKGKSWVKIDLQDGFSAGGAFGAKELLALRQAAKDDRVEGLLVEGNTDGVPLTSIQDLAKAVEAFKEKKTKFFIRGENVWLDTLYLAQSFQEVFLAPGSVFILEYPAYELPFIADLLENVGIKADFAKSNPYKAGPDRYIASKISSYQRENLSILLDNLKEQLFKYIEANPRISADELASAEERIILSSNQILEYGWVDGFEHEWEEDDKHYVPLMDYYSSVQNNGVGIGLLHFDGIIPNAGFDSFVEGLNSFKDDKNVKSILIQISSPGGSLYHSLALRDLVKSVNKVKPVVVYAGDYMGSGAYLATSSASYISVSPMSIIGSIGVYGGKLSYKGLFENIGVHWDVVGEPHYYSDIFDHSKKQKRAQEMSIRETWLLFVDIVSEDRKMDHDKVAFLATGEIWSGKYSVEADHGIVDSDGGLADGLGKAVELAGATNGEFYLIEPESERSTFIGDILRPLARKIIDEKVDELKRDLPGVIKESVEAMVFPQFRLK